MREKIAAHFYFLHLCRKSEYIIVRRKKEGMHGMTELPVQIQVKRVKTHRLDIHYPVVYGLKNREIEQRMNYEITATVHQLLVDQGFYQNPMTTITATFELKTNEKNVLSLVLINYAYSGGAHGITLMKGLTFDITTGKKYSLKELFKPNSNYVQRLSQIVSEQIKARNLPLISDFTHISTDQPFYISDKVLVLYFALYELTPYAYGFPYFPISVYDIQDIINEQSPLGKML